MSVAFYTLPPPYGTFEPIDAAKLLNGTRRISPGTLVVLRPRHDTPVTEVVEAIDRTYEAVPSATLILWLDLVPSRRRANLVSHASEKGIRGIVQGTVPDRLELGEQLTDLADLRHDVPARLMLWGFHINEASVQFVRGVIADARNVRTVTALLTPLKLGYSSVLGDLKRAGLGTPRDLFEVLRLLCIAVEIQREKMQLDAIADRYYYWDAASLRKRFDDVLGAPPTRFRNTLGWAWILRQALRRAGLTIPTAGTP